MRGKRMDIEGHARREPDAFRPAPRLLATLCFSAEKDFLALARTATTHVAGLLDLPLSRTNDLRLAVDEACALFLASAPAPVDEAAFGEAAFGEAPAGEAAVANEAADEATRGETRGGDLIASRPIGNDLIGGQVTSVGVAGGGAMGGQVTGVGPTGGGVVRGDATSSGAPTRSGPTGYRATGVASAGGESTGGLALVFAEIGGELRVTVSGPIPSRQPESNSLGWMLMCALVGEPRWEVEDDVGILTLWQPIPILRG